jgi:hypothetical protein
MLPSSRLVAGTVLALAVAAGEARAQYYPYYYPRGYGGYGWGGWGGTVQGDIARGLGYYAVGAGAYNRQTAVANAINADTVMRWNQYMFLSQMEANRRERETLARRQKRDSMTGELLYQRFRDNPTDGDVEHGDALNVILDQLTDPAKIHSSALRLADAKLSGDAVDDIPFVHASDAVSLSLHQLTNSDGWPIGLRGEEFAAARKAYQDAVAKVLEEDEKGDLSAGTVQAVRDAAAGLRAKLEASPPKDRDEYIEAENYVKTLTGLARMLDKPNVDKILAELEKVRSTTVGNLLGFMHTYNLRFGVAETPRQRAVYHELYPVLAATRDKIVQGGGTGDTAVARGAKPTDFFSGMHLDDLTGKPSGAR